MHGDFFFLSVYRREPSVPSVGLSQVHLKFFLKS